MEIQWLGHSALRIRSGNITLVTDPYESSLGISLEGQQADVVTMSNQHPHHSNLAAIQGQPRVLRGPGEYEIGSLYISGIGTPLGNPDERREINTMFTIRAEGLTLCHLGDISRPLSSRQVEALRNVDVLMAPVGGACTLAVSKVAELVNLITPRILIPLHYSPDSSGDAELGPLDAFIRAMGLSESDLSPQNRLNVTSTNLPREMRLVPLQRVA
ncbi:MAG: MBL fold metallo-hydrolase [Chloroflexi bacterium]|nr:MBL fold metallo-hydrolase [Chloroflexota bacterium]